MPSSYSSGKGLELITTGEQAGTWGESTNENLKKIDQALTQWCTISIGNETLAPSTWASGASDNDVTGALTIKIDQSANALASGTEPRAQFIEIKQGTSGPSGDFNVFITGESVARTPFNGWVHNFTNYSAFVYPGSTGATVAKASRYEIKSKQVAHLCAYVGSPPSDDYFENLGRIVVANEQLSVCNNDSTSVSVNEARFVLNANSGFYGGAGTGSDTVAIGHGAGNCADSDGDPTAGKSDNDCVYIGNKAGANQIDETNNVVIGSLAAEDRTKGDDNTIIGYRANGEGSLDTTGQNTLIGSDSGRYINNSGNAAVGWKALQCNDASQADNGGAYQSTAIGAGAMQNAGQDGVGDAFVNACVAVGYGSLKGDVNVFTGDWNVAVGSRNGEDCTTGHSNTLIGHAAGTQLTEGIGNIAVGYDSGHGSAGAWTGDYNIAIGYAAGKNNSASNKCITIGYAVGSTAVPGADSLLFVDTENQASDFANKYFIYGDMANDRLNFNSDQSSGSHVKIQNENAASANYDFLECKANGVSQFSVKGNGKVISQLKPSLFGLTVTVLGTSGTLNYEVNRIYANDYTGANAQAVTLPAATSGDIVVHAQAVDTTGGTNALSFNCDGSDSFETGSVIESRTTNKVTFDTSTAGETLLTYTPADAVTNLFSIGSYIYFVCITAGEWQVSYDFQHIGSGTTGAWAFDS